MKLYFNIILLLLAPTILLSNEWKKVDLPNLNNGRIQDVIYLDNYYYFKKWDGSFVRSKDLLAWEGVNIETLNKLKTYYSPKVKGLDSKPQSERVNNNFIQSLDSGVYSYIGNMLFIFKNEKLDSIKLDNLNTFEDGVIVFKYNDELQILVRLRKPKTFDYYLFTTEIVEDSLKPKKVIRNSLTSNSNSKPILVNDFLISTGTPNPIAIDLRTNGERIFDIIIPKNSYIYEYHIKGDTLSIFDFQQIKHREFSLTTNTVYCNDYTEEYGYEYFPMHEIWDIKFNITELVKKTDKGKYISKYQFNIYDHNDVKVKVIELGEEYYSNDKIKIIHIEDEFALLSEKGDLFKLSRKDLELKILSSTFRSIIKEKNRLIAISSFGDYISYQYSEDFGETWKGQSISKELSSLRYIDEHTDISNSHRLFFIDDNVYSFTYDSVYYSKLGSDEFKLLEYYENSQVFRYNDILYFLDVSSGKIYMLKDGNEITEMKIENFEHATIHQIELDNGYLYASDFYNLYRLELEKDCSSFFHFLQCLFGC